ncbi:MAG: hypothetical protein IRZ01_06455 [Thermoflavifilum aggregans]|uniref:Uncharacterized protein n=1 Tax=Thermoflavifilum thermophilum TaxID=1393122 RepID=A0A1I7N2H8_9BACT|nr:hypothetical protein [Thermoflavifilum thermophilum]MBX6380306.1 hypothetical protein [Thermoflavifilum aggregans]SFV28879.1 hypothetical protein SAMN05660895_0431 [Thermoflavifilum thermophilum]
MENTTRDKKRLQVSIWFSLLLGGLLGLLFENVRIGLIIGLLIGLLSISLVKKQ